MGFLARIGQSVIRTDRKLNYLAQTARQRERAKKRYLPAVPRSVFLKTNVMEHKTAG